MKTNSVVTYQPNIPGSVPISFCRYSGKVTLTDGDQTVEINAGCEALQSGVLRYLASIADARYSDDQPDLARAYLEEVIATATEVIRKMDETRQLQQPLQS